MASRYGDANENGNQDVCDLNQGIALRRRPTRHFGSATAHHQYVFKPFTQDSIKNIQTRRASRVKRQSSAFLDPSRAPLKPDPYLASGQQLPPALIRQLPVELVGQPIEDIDPYYADRETFVIISRGKEITRFSANNALYLFGPFHPIRRVVLYILVSSIFNLLVILTILINCILMTIQGSETVERTEIIFTTVYTTEMGLKVLARGFILDDFTYLRDPWNWLDFAVIIMAYLTIVIQDLGNLSVMRTFRVLRALKTVAIIPGLQIYMGVLTQKCIKDGPSNMTDIEWHEWCSNSSHWIPEVDEEIFGAYRLCGNASGAQMCPPDHTCLQGFGFNPDYGFTNFDTFGWALICSFRLMTQDFWEGLYMQILKTAGSWHIIFFIVSIFLGSIYLMNLILAIVAMSYNELQRRAEEEEEAAAEDEAAFLESCRLMEMQDHLSQLSRSSPEVGTSYRPSVEIGLVGQSLLASLCQNGLLGQHVREKLDQQMILPDSASIAIRSHSLSVNLEHRNSNVANQWPINLSARYHKHNYDPLTTATSMTELRRKSSVKTNDSYSPTGPSEAQFLGQRRLLPNIGVSGNRLDRRKSFRSNRGSLHHHVSSSVLMSRKDSEQANDSPSGGRRFPARSSTTSVKDLQILKQRAAMIRIVSDDCSEIKPEADGLKNAARMSMSFNEPSDECTSDQQLDSEQTDRLYVARQCSPKRRSYNERESMLKKGRQKIPNTEAQSQIQAQSYRPLQSFDSDFAATRSLPRVPDETDRVQSEAAICGQPTQMHPLGRLATQSRPRRLSRGRKSCSIQQSSRRPSVFSDVGRPSTKPDPSSQSEFNHDSLQLHFPMSGQLKTGKSAHPFECRSSLQQTAGQLGGSMRTLQSVQTSPTDTTQSSVGKITRRLDVEKPDRMHHLSVENFQHFGATRPMPLHQQQQQFAVERPAVNPRSEVDLSSCDGPHSVLEQSLSSYYKQQCRLDSRSYIHPATMVRSSISRPRQSVFTGSSIAPGVRRMSKDFVRRASDWSHLSTNTNVDLRRLLRLWSHTNPYQGRPSISSCSNFSQTGQSNRLNTESPAHSIRSGMPPTINNPRPSSVGSAWQAYEIISALSRRNQYQSDARGYASIPLDDNLMADQMSINMRDKCIAYCLSCLDILCIWECCGVWIKIQRIISLVVFDPFTELFIILCILINTLFMALDSDDADAQMRSIFEKGNYFFTATFAVEASMKIMALSPKFYFREGWNLFDSFIVGLSLLELGLEGVYGLSVLRSFRLLRVFKLAKSWPTLNLLISIMGKAVGDLGNLTFVLAIIVFIFAVMGMQLFGNKYVAGNFPSGELPRWNFTDFMHSFMIVFRILCAEWIEPMWDCLLVGGWPCIPFFLIAVTVGNLVVLNLFLALLLASFGASNLSSPQADNVDTKKLQEAIARFSRFGKWIRRSTSSLLRRVSSCLLRKKRQSGLDTGQYGFAANHEYGDRGKPMKSTIVTMSRMERQQNIEKRTEELKNKIRRSPEHHYHLRQLVKSQLKQSSAHIPYSQSGFNYNYNQRQVAYSSTSLRDARSSPMPMIPIIVNEATEFNDDEDNITGEEYEQKAMESKDQQAATVTDLDELSSLSSDSVSLQTQDFNSHSCQEQDPSKKMINIMMNNSRHMGYLNNMQPIREDSNDSVPSSNQSVEHNQASCLQPPQLDREVPSKSTSDLVSAFNLRDGFKAQSILQTNSQQQSKVAEESLLDVKCPMLKSRSEPESFNRIGREEMKDSKLLDEPEVDSMVEQEGELSGEQRPKSSLYLKAPKRQEMEEDDEKTLQHIETYIERCICIGIVCLKWFLFRQYVRKIVEHKYFDQCILILIVISSGTLALEDKHLNERPTLKQTLDVLDTIFTIIFSLEMIFKWLAFGMRRYFGNIWSWLDFIIVLVSFINLMASIFGSGKIQALKTMRTLRAMRGLRPLRALQRFQGMRVVVNALIQAIPSIFNVLLVCLIFWLIFSIMGVQMFGGKFWRCLSPETGEVVGYEVAANRFECIERNLTWANPQINFDNVLNAYLALFQVATFKGWIDIMNSATDSRNRDDQPIREANIYMYFYFVFFVIIGSFFTLNLFIGVIIDNFNEQKKKTGGSLEIFMTDDQKKYYHAMKKMRSKKPIKAMTRPKFKLQAYMFDITTSKKFDLAIMIIIGLNMFVMALEHYGQSAEFSSVLENLNLIFIAIFTLECLCKIFAMRHFYFREPWNIFDFIVVDLSILGVVMKEYVAKYFVSPTLLRVVRVVKVGRVLRLVKGAKGIRTLLFALAMSLPALFNICLLLFLVMFIYAIFGMSFFMNVRKRSGIDESFNFETFTSSIIVLFQMSTSAGWDLVLDPLMDEENDCQKPDPALGIEGTCGNKGIAIAYLISYVIVTFLIIINMYIAVILENYSQATEDVQEGLTDDDYEMYYEIWQKFDPNGTQYLPYEKLSDFVDSLEDPLRISKPNELALVILDINIYEGNQCYCVDILDALTKYFFTRKGLVIQVNEHLQKVQSTLHETPFQRVTTTYMLKREHYCAKVIQNCWRKWRERVALANQPGQE